MELILAVYADLKGKIVAMRKALLDTFPEGAIDGVPLDEWRTRETRDSSERQALNLGDRFPVPGERLLEILKILQQDDPGV